MNQPLSRPRRLLYTVLGVGLHDGRPARTRPSSPSRRLAGYFTSWLPLFIIYCFAMRQAGAPDWPSAVVYALSYIGPAALIGAYFWFKVARRIDWAEMRWPRILLVEFLCAIIFTGWLHATFALYLRLVGGPRLMHKVMDNALGWELLTGGLVYAVQAAIFHVLRVSRALREKEVATVQAEALQARAEMEALRGQLNPHFLFNSLHSITALVRDDPARAEEALLQFAALLRRVLDIKRESGDETTLADEMKFVDDYLAIEQLRLGERLRVARELSSDALECWLPVFSVQPLLENAVRHAVASRRDGGCITIRAAVKSGRLEVDVDDDGPGADPAAVANATGVGLSVIRRRLALRHGTAATLEVATKPGAGFRVHLSLPAESAPSVEGIS